MASVASHCSAVRRISVAPNGTSPALLDSSLGTWPDFISSAMSELEVDEGTAARGADAKVKDHRHRESNAHKPRRKEMTEPRFVEERVAPDAGDQCEHEDRHIRNTPRRGRDS